MMLNHVYSSVMYCWFATSLPVVPYCLQLCHVLVILERSTQWNNQQVRALPVLVEWWGVKVGLLHAGRLANGNERSQARYGIQRMWKGALL
jgi:hypothetical protein